MSAPATATIAPQYLEAEISVLGACLQDFEAAKKAAEILTAGDFFSDAHGEIFSGIQSLVARGVTPDIVMVADALMRGGKLEAVGGATYLYDLVEKTSTAANVAHHARLVREKSNLRRIMDTCTRTAENARNGGDPAELAANLREALDEIRTGEDGRPFLVRAAELKADPVSFTVHSLIPAGMLSLLSGKDKRGKTLLAQEIVRAVLRGAAFLDRFPCERGPVVGAFLDDPTSLTLDRLEALGMRHNPELYLVPPLAFDGDAMRFLDRLEAAVARVRPVLVVVDSFYQLVPSGRDAGNDQARMGPLMARLNRLATVSAVLAVAHDNKAGADVAGSHVIRAAAKCILRLTLPRGAETEDEDGPPATPRRILTLESKFAAASSWALEIRGVGDWRCCGSPRELRASDTLGAVRAFLADGGTGTAEEIAKAVKRRLEDVQTALKLLNPPGESRKGKRGRTATVYRGGEFPSQPDFPSEAREGNSEAQLLNFPKVAGAEDFPSRISPPREAGREGNSLEAPAEVETWDPC
jgi:archaellum biogenesis ATPase FlaH